MPELLHRFVVANDLHIGADNHSTTEIVGRYNNDGDALDVSDSFERGEVLLQVVQEEHADKPLDFFMINGDLSTNSLAKAGLEHVRDNIFAPLSPLPCYASFGNHDRVDEADWQDVFGFARDHTFEFGDYGFIVINSSSSAGARAVCRSEDFLEAALNGFKDKKGVIFFSHIARHSGGFRDDPVLDDFMAGTDSPECTQILDMLENQENLLFSMHGHFHHDNSIEIVRNFPCIFGGHIGTYGTPYYNIRIVEIYDDGNVYVIIHKFIPEKDGDNYIINTVERQITNIGNRYNRYTKLVPQPGKKVFIPFDM